MCVGKIITQGVRAMLGTSAMALVLFNSIHLFGYNGEHVFVQ